MPEPLQTQSQCPSQKQLMHESDEGSHGGVDAEVNVVDVIALSISPPDIAVPQLSANIHPRIGNCRKMKHTWSEKRREIVQKKLALLNENFRPVLLSPGKTLDLSSHEGLFRALGLWNFAHLEFDREIRRDLLAHLIAYYDPSNRLSYVHGCRISVTRRDLCMAIDLPTKKEKFCVFQGLNSINDIVYSDKTIKALLAFMSNYMLLVDNMCFLPSEILGAIELVKDGLARKVDWGKAMWVLVERELLNVPMDGTCYYASYMQRLIKSQRPHLFSKEPECIFRYVPEPEKEEISLEDDEDDLVEEVSFVEYEGDAEATKMQSMDVLGNETTEKRVSDLGLIQNGEENMVNCVGEGAKLLFNEEKSNGCVHFLQLHNRKPSDGIDVDDVSEEDDYEKQKERCLDDLPVSAKLSDSNRTTSSDMNIHLEQNKVKRLMHVICAEDDQFDRHDQPKRKRSCAPSLSNEPSTFHECLNLIQGGMRRAKALNAEKEEALENLETHVQHLSDILREKEHLSRSLKKMVDDQQPTWQMAVHHYESEISMVSRIMLGYRRALKETRNRFAEYRKKHSHGDESLYKDVPGTGGLVLSARDFEKLRLEKAIEIRLKASQALDNLEKILNKFKECGDSLASHEKKLVYLSEEVRQLKRRVVKSSSSGT